ncbi:MAG: hypothetical protein CMK07_06360 [Ponticaulis sp.]|nr:hypothetical protein [Ponticaulis sp.]
MTTTDTPSQKAVIHSLFAIPLMSIPGFANASMIDQLLESFSKSRFQSNSHHAALSHSSMLGADELSELSRLIPGLDDHLRVFGEQLFGERLLWQIKEAWFNRLEHGGVQHDHIHANSFVSGVLYLSDSDQSANPVFHRPSGGAEFVFSNFHAESMVTPYNAARWQLPKISAGDLILFPSYLRHGVPMNNGSSRLSLAFNAIPNRLNSWGYEIQFSEA